MSKIIGHKKILNFFDTLVESSELSHAYSLVGPQDVGRMSIIREISSSILQLDTGKLENHPDFRLVTREETDQGSKRKSITVSQIRKSREFVAKQPYKSNRKILVIKEAEKMNKSAANAFLKTLEEPADFTTIFLSVLDENMIPDTIASRSQNIYVRPVEKQKIEQHVLDQGYDKNFARSVALASMGLQEKTKKWIENEDEFNQIKQETSKLNNLVGIPFYEKLQEMDQIHNKSGREGREEASQILTNWQLILQLLLLDQSESRKIKEFSMDKLKEMSYEQIRDLIKEINKAKQKIHQNINLKLLIERVLLKIP